MSLFNYLDTEETGFVTFEQMLKWIIPASTEQDMMRMTKWIFEEEENVEKGIVNYKLPKYIEKKNKGLKTLNFS